MTDVKCTHCNLVFHKSAMIKEKSGEKTLYFCCKGCQGVYNLLSSEGLNTFYTRLGTNTLTPPNKAFDDLEKFDLEGFVKKYVRVSSDGFSEISLIIEGIHCSACVWLNEKILHKTPGVLEATINYTNNKAKVVWDSNTVKLSEIIKTIRSIGYDAFPYDPKLQEERAVKTRREYYSRILTAIFGMMNIMWIAIAQYAGYFDGIEQKHKDILNVAEFVLATPVLFYSGWVFFRGAYYGYKNRTVNMDTLVATGASLSYIYSIYAMVSRHGEVYFDSVVMIITFILIGKYLEVLSKKQAIDTLDLISSTTPTEVTLLSGKKRVLTPIENVKIGDTIEVKAGDKVVIDGKIIDGSASFDESSLSGESLPVLKTKGDEILSGSLCIDSTIKYTALKDASSSLLHSIVALLEDSITKKPRIEQLANSISGYFSPIILLIAIATFTSWYLLGFGFERSLIVAISVIVIACPCALGLATPMSTLMGISVAAKNGILFKEATYLETMAKCDTVALDKTGTLTEGKPKVINTTLLKEFDHSLLYTLAKNSNHPISEGIQEYLIANFKGMDELELTQINSLQAKGISAKYGNQNIFGGNALLMRDNAIAVEFNSSNLLFFFAIDKEIYAIFELKDTPKIDAKEMVDTLKALELDIVMLTGDHEKSAKSIANELGIKDVRYSLLPTDKAEIIDALHTKDHKVVMVGDGINDSIALAKSDIAIAVGSGADIAISVSDVVLLSDNAIKISQAFQIAKRTYQAIKENLTFSILYNIVAVPLAALGFIYPLLAALSMSLSSLVVVGNSMRIRNIKFKEQK